MTTPIISLPRKSSGLYLRQEFEVTQNSATDAPFSHDLTDEFKPGLYVDITTGEPSSFPLINLNLTVVGLSFTKPIAKDVIKYYQDDSHGVESVSEVRSRIGNAHFRPCI